MTSLPQVDLPPATGQLVGYIRVSTDHQTHDAQRDALQYLGVSRIFADKMSGVRDDRTGYRALLDYPYSAVRCGSRCRTSRSVFNPAAIRAR